jgi:hypothetical protein
MMDWSARFPPINLNIIERGALAKRILTQLAAAVPGSTALLRGSLAEGRGDSYSDIDILWEVPDVSFSDAIERVSAVMAAIQAVESIRTDPDFQRSVGRRLFFIRFADVPLFWRVDLDVFAASVGRDFSYDTDNPLARGSEWSRTESALANCVAAVKAHLRGKEASANSLLRRAFERVAAPLPSSPLPVQLLALTDTVTAIDPTTSPFAERIRQLIREVFE